MKLCYNSIMKFIVKLLIICIMLCSPVFAAKFDVLVLPVELLETKENYYGFDEVSEIIANDIINNFNLSNGKIASPDLYALRAKLNQNADMKKTAANALKKYKTTNSIDYAEFKKLGNMFSCNSVLIVYSSAVTNKNSLKRGIWEVLEVASVFDISYPYRMQTSVVLLDTVNDLVMWSNNYSTKLGANDNVFAAKNYAQADAELEKIRKYSKDIVASAASQNIMLRFFPKTIRPLEKNIQENTGGALRFDRTIPDKPKEKKNAPDGFYGDMIYGF